MRGLVFCLFMAISVMAQSQELSWENPVFETEDLRYELVDVDNWGRATVSYTKYENGMIKETGNFLDMKKHGVWYQYDAKGNVISSIKYDNDIRAWLRTVVEGKKVYIIYKNGRAAEVTYYLAIN